MKARIIGYEIIDEKPRVFRWDGDQPVFYKEQQKSFVNMTIQFDLNDIDGVVPNEISGILQADELEVSREY